MPKVPPPPPQPPTASDHFLRLLTRLGRFAGDFAGIFFMALALMTLLGLLLPQLASGLLSWWAGELSLWLGWGSLWFVLGCGLFGLWLFRRTPERPATGRFWLRVIALEAAALASLALLSVWGGASVERAEASLDGGQVGWGLARLLQIALQPLGLDSLVWQGLCLSVFFLVALFTGLGLSRWLGWLGKRARQILAVDGAPATGYVEFLPGRQRSAYAKRCLCFCPRSPGPSQAAGSTAPVPQELPPAARSFSSGWRATPSR